MDETYLYPVPKGKWAVRRLVEGRWIDLVQDSYMDNPQDAEAVLRVLGISASEGNLEKYFPHRPRQGRCPTLELMELCNVLDPTNPQVKREKVYGV